MAHLGFAVLVALFLGFPFQAKGEEEHSHSRVGDSRGTLPRPTDLEPSKTPDTHRRAAEEPQFLAAQGIEANPVYLDWKAIGITQESLLKSAGVSLAEKLKDAEQIKARNEQQGFLYAELAASGSCPSEEFLKRLLDGEIDPNLLAVDVRVDKHFNGCFQQFLKKHLANELGKSLAVEVCLNENGIKELISKTKGKLKGPFFKYMAVKKFGAAGLAVPELVAQRASKEPLPDRSAEMASDIQSQIDDALDSWVSEGLSSKLAECSKFVDLQKSDLKLKDHARKIWQGFSDLMAQRATKAPGPDLFADGPSEAVKDLAKFAKEMEADPRGLYTEAANKYLESKKSVPAERKAFNYEERLKALEKERSGLVERLASSPTGKRHSDHFRTVMNTLLDRAKESLDNKDEALFYSTWSIYNSTWEKLEAWDKQEESLLPSKPLGSPNRLQSPQNESPPSLGPSNLQHYLRGPLKGGGM